MFVKLATTNTKMFSKNLTKFIKYSVIGSVGIGTAYTLKRNNYDINSLGVVRLGSAASIVFDISLNYKSNLYRGAHDVNSSEYLKLRSECHTYAAKRMLDLCCVNKGVYIKVGQHLAALDYLLPKEYIETLRVLHKDAPRNTLEEVYRVIREDLKADVSLIFILNLVLILNWNIFCSQIKFSSP